MAGAPAPPGRDPLASQQHGDDADWSRPTSVRATGTAPSLPGSRNSLGSPGSARRRPSPWPARDAQPQLDLDGYTAHERGLPGWAALVVLIVIAGIGGLIDTINGAQVRGGFNYGIVVASIVAILIVRRSSMFPVVIAPPLVYSGASAAMLYVRSSGLHDRKVLFDAAANWLVYGFPAIAGASAAVLIIAGIRLVARR